MKAPAELPANIIDSCTEFRPELQFLGSLYTNSTKVAQAAERTRHWTWPELFMVISNHPFKMQNAQPNQLFMKEMPTSAHTKHLQAAIRLLNTGGIA